MNKVLIVGNIIKDVYLALDEERNHFELDDKSIPWLDLALDGSKLFYHKRAAILSGAATTMEVLNNLSLDATIAGKNVKFGDDGLCFGSEDERCNDYRYILNLGKNVTYLTSGYHSTTTWQAPKEIIDFIYIDRSAKITPEILDSIKSYLSLSPHTRVALFLNNQQKSPLSVTEQSLIKLSDLIFVDRFIKDLPSSAKVYEISKHQIKNREFTQNFHVKKTNLTTSLTIKSIVSATILGALILGRTSREAMELAKINVEHAKLNRSLKLAKLQKIHDESKVTKTNLRSIAKALVSSGKGILAADESGGSIHKKFEEAGIPDDEKHRRDYRNIFFTTKDLSRHVNGVILFDETARQKADDGTNFVSFLTNLGIIPGIKVDQGLESFPQPAYATEKWTKGLDGIEKRLTEYFEMGLRFAKWRAAFEVQIDQNRLLTPSNFAVSENVKILARYAKACQDAGIVPIVEPELVHSGDYSQDACAKITGFILDRLFEELKEQQVDLPACILKTNMILAGKKFPQQSTPIEVGQATATVLKNHVPRELAGVVFLSGGQSVIQSTDNLRAVIKNGPFPWPVTFSFARALQEPALSAWKGNNLNILEARDAFYARLVANTQALKV